ncbi:Protein kinase superfamily protein [Euphorbia peplus]|nr:Protein kinase superfamily protein [Euphorbia peplus]
MSLIFVIITVIFLHPPTLVQANDFRYENCSTPFRCGNITDIGYPFWRSNRPDYCGHPGFHLNCSGEQALITITKLTYQILNINAESSSLTVARTDYIGTVCPTLLYNTTLDFSLFTYSSDIENITMFYGCPTIPSQFITTGIYQFNCAGLNGTNIGGYFLTRNLSNGNLGSVLNPYLRSCTNNRVMVPVYEEAIPLLESNSRQENLVAALNQGFGVQWIANNSLCSTCRLSGGRCGYNTSTMSFTCYCSDQPYSFSCSSSPSSPSQPGMSTLLIFSVR